MTSWRDAASQRVQDDLDGLLGSALDFAQQQLEKHGELYPYAVVVDADGQHRMVTAVADSDRPDSAGLITSLIASLSGERDRLRGTAIVADVHLPESGGDAVRVILEHSERVALTVLLPYHTRRFGSGVEYGGLQAGPAAAFIWPND